MKKILTSLAAVCALFAAPSLAEAAVRGVATANVNMRSGPSTAYPAVVVIPVGAPVTINGCMSSVNWCDVSFAGGRGWVSGNYVQATYRSNRVYVAPDYYRGLGIPSVTFDVDTYWGRYYRNRDFYRQRDRWRDYDWDRADRLPPPPPPPRWDRDRDRNWDRDRDRDWNRDRDRDRFDPRDQPPRWDRDRDRDRDNFDRNRDRDNFDRNRDRDDRRPPPRVDPEPPRGDPRPPRVDPPRADPPRFDPPRGDDRPRRPPPQVEGPTGGGAGCIPGTPGCTVPLPN